MRYKKTIAVRFLPDEYARIYERVKRCEGKTFSDRFRVFMRDAVMEEGQ